MSSVNVPFGSGRVAREVNIKSALGEQCDEDVFDAKSHDELPGEQNRALLSLRRGRCAREGAGS